MFPPNSLICVVTTASPIQTSAKTPEKTVVFCLLDAVIDRSKLRSRQNINGPLCALDQDLSLRNLQELRGSGSGNGNGNGNGGLPKIPVP